MKNIEEFIKDLIKLSHKHNVVITSIANGRVEVSDFNEYKRWLDVINYKVLNDMKENITVNKLFHEIDELNWNYFYFNLIAPIDNFDDLLIEHSEED